MDLKIFKVCKETISDLDKLEKLKQLTSQEKKDINKTDEAGCTPILYLAAEGNLLCFNYLLEHGANIHDCDYEGFDSKWIAYELGHDELLTFIQHYQAKTKTSFAVDADDSSDEDEMSLQNKLYYLDDSYDAFKWPESAPQTVGETDPKHYSFLAHAISLKVLYSDTVNKRYYELKHSLPKTRILSENKVLFNWVFESFKSLLSNVFPEEHRQANLLNRLKNDFLSKNKAWIKEQIQSVIKKDTRVLIKQLHTYKAMNAFTVFTMTLRSKLKDTINAFDFANEKFEHAPYLDGETFEPQLRQILRNKLINSGYLNETTNKFIVANIKPIKAKDSIKKWILSTLSNVKGTTTFNSYYSQDYATQLLNVLCEKESTREAQSVIYKNKNGYHFKRKTTKENLQNSSLNVLFTDRDESSISYYLAYHPDCLKNDLDSAVVREFTSQKFTMTLKETKSDYSIALERGLKPQQYTFNSNDFNEFLANIRLSMRIQKRRLRQACDDEESDKITGEAFQAAWKFGNNPRYALESQEIGTNLSRTDLVVNLGSYKAIYTRLKAYKSIHVEMAQWMIQGTIFDAAALESEFKKTQIPKKEYKSCNNLMVDLFYLMLGCEVQRNPGSLLTNLINIHLIAENRATWRDVLAHPDYETNCGGGLSSTSMGKYRLNPEDKKKIDSNPVQSARLLQSYYEFFSIKNASYAGSKANESIKSRDSKHITEFVRREKVNIKNGLSISNPEDESPYGVLTELRDFAHKL